MSLEQSADLELFEVGGVAGYYVLDGGVLHCSIYRSKELLNTRPVAFKKDQEKQKRNQVPKTRLPAVSSWLNYDECYACWFWLAVIIVARNSIQSGITNQESQHFNLQIGERTAAPLVQLSRIAAYLAEKALF